MRKIIMKNVGRLQVSLVLRENSAIYRGKCIVDVSRSHNSPNRDRSRSHLVQWRVSNDRSRGTSIFARLLEEAVVRPVASGRVYLIRREGGGKDRHDKAAVEG